MGLLDGRVVVVVGGGRGVGRAEALACARAGAAVMVSDLGCDVHGVGEDPSVAAAVAREITEAGGHAVADHTDLGSAGGASRILAHALQALGRVDCVIGAAGLIVSRTVLKMDDAVLDRMIDVHVKGSFALVRAGARAMIDGGHGGSILLHTAPVGFFGAARQSALAATSAAVAGLVRSAAIEMRKHDVRVNALAPTARTRTTEDLPLFQGIAETSMSPAFVAPVAVHLASDAAVDVSGEVIGVAGTRIYALGGRETPGAFGGGEPLAAKDVAVVLPDATRP